MLNESYRDGLKTMLKDYAHARGLLIFYGYTPESNDDLKITFATTNNNSITGRKDIGSPIYVRWSEVKNIWDALDSITKEIDARLGKLYCRNISEETVESMYPNVIFGDVREKLLAHYAEYSRSLSERVAKIRKNEKEVAPFSTKTVPPIRDVIVNGPATIIFWADGTKTVVKCENEEFDLEKGLSMAIAKKALGNTHEYYETFKRWLGKLKKKRKGADK